MTYVLVEKAEIGKGAPSVKFKYYHKVDEFNYKLIDYTDSKAISPYTDEVLNSQNVSAIIHGIGISPVYKFDLFRSLPNAFKQFGSDCNGGTCQRPADRKQSRVQVQDKTDRGDRSEIEGFGGKR